MAIVDNVDMVDDNNYSTVCDDIVRSYVDKFASCFIMFHLSMEVGEDLNYSDLYTPELDRYIDFEGTMPLWEAENKGMLINVILDGLFTYCLDVAGKFPKKNKEFYEKRWNRNIAIGLKNIED